VSDLSESFYRRACTFLATQQEVVERCGLLLDAQRAALRCNDIDLLDDLADQSAFDLEGLEPAGRHLQGALAETRGPRRDQLQQLLHGLSSGLQLVLAGSIEMAAEVRTGREAAVRSILELEQGHASLFGNSCRNGWRESAFLDRSG
jgi:hypothetical protein